MSKDASKRKKLPVSKAEDFPGESSFSNRQLDIFQNFYTTNELKDSSSNSIELWDSIPKYSISRKAMAEMRDANGYLGIYKTEFHHRGAKFDISIHPALIEVKDGEASKTEAYYPSASEEIIEAALVKLASQQNVGFHEKEKRTGVTFSLHQLREELKSRGHTRSFTEIVQSLNILSLSVIEINNGDKKEKRFARSPFIPTIVGVTRKDLAEEPNARWYVQFHPLVTNSIDKLEYRQFNYQKLMQHKTQLARWLHRLIVNKWTNASMMHRFQIYYSTVKRDSNMLEGYARERDAVAACDAGMNELVSQGLITKFDRDTQRGPRGKIKDVIYYLYPTQQFIQEVKAANKRQKDARMMLDK